MIKTKSLFYYGFEVESGQNFIDFTEASTPLVNRIAELAPAKYSMTEFFSELARALTAAGTQSYTCTFNRATRIAQISAPASFTLLSFSGQFTAGTLWDKIGIDKTSDQSGTNVSGVNPAGKAYRPQFYLLDYLDSEKNKDAVDSSINETASGRVESITFGLKKLVEMNIGLINNYTWANDINVDYDINGIANAVEFMDNIIQKSRIEFMPDRDDVNTFETLRLESTEKSSKGTGYRLRESTNIAPDIFETGRLIFRKIEG